MPLPREWTRKDEQKKRGGRPLPRAGGGRSRPPDGRLGSEWTRSRALVSDGVTPRTCGRQTLALPCSPAPQKTTAYD